MGMFYVYVLCKLNGLNLSADEKAKCSVPFGLLHEVAYKVVGDREGREIVVSTTRPETIFGDRAIAVHPNDPRYSVSSHYPEVATSRSSEATCSGEATRSSEVDDKASNRTFTKN